MVLPDMLLAKEIIMFYLLSPMLSQV